MRSRSPKSNHFFPMSQLVFLSLKVSTGGLCGKTRLFKLSDNYSNILGLK